MATTTMLKNSAAAREVKRGAINTPARPAKNDESAQADADTRSAGIPLSSVIRGLSTTARMRRPITVNLKSSASPMVAEIATIIAASSFRLNEYTSHTL